MQIEPDAKIVQTHLGSQTSLKASQIVRTFTRQAKGIQEFVVDGFNDVPDTGQPSPHRFGPALPRAGLVRRGDHLDLLLLLPAAAWSRPGKAFISHIVALSGQPATSQARRWMLTERKQSRGQPLIVRDFPLQSQSR